MTCDAERVDEAFEPQTFDLVFSSNMLEHLPDPGRALRAMRTVMQDDGIAIHVVPSPFWKTTHVLGFYVNAIVGRLDRRLRRAGTTGPDAAAGSAAGADDWDNNPKVASGQRSYLARLLWPAAHGASGSNLREFTLFTRRYWRAQFEAAGFCVAAMHRGPVSSGYGFGLDWLRSALERLGLSSETIYITYKAESPVARQPSWSWPSAILSRAKQMSVQAVPDAPVTSTGAAQVNRKPRQAAALVFFIIAACVSALLPAMQARSVLAMPAVSGSAMSSAAACLQVGSGYLSSPNPNVYEQDVYLHWTGTITAARLVGYEFNAGGSYGRPIKVNGVQIGAATGKHGGEPQCRGFDGGQQPESWPITNLSVLKQGKNTLRIEVDPALSDNSWGISRAQIEVTGTGVDGRHYRLTTIASTYFNNWQWYDTTGKLAPYANEGTWTDIMEPQGYDGSKPTPLLISAHGFGSNAWESMEDYHDAAACPGLAARIGRLPRRSMERFSRHGPGHGHSHAGHRPPLHGVTGVTVGRPRHRQLHASPLQRRPHAHLPRRALDGRHDGAAGRRSLRG